MFVNVVKLKYEKRKMCRFTKKWIKKYGFESFLILKKRKKEKFRKKRRVSRHGERYISKLHCYLSRRKC